MLGKILKYKKVFTLALIIIIAGLLMPTHMVSAGIIDNFATDAILGVIGVLIDFLSGVFGLVLLPLGASIVNWVFGTLGSISFIRAPIVDIGWKISRDIANMGFILVLLLIGFSTIIKYDTYGIKQLLPRLIIIALLINFSLAISGVFISMGNELGHFFTTGGNSNARVGDSIMVATAMSKSVEISPDLEQRLRESNDLGKTVFIQALMRLIVTIVITFLMLAMALIMLWRVVYLWILLILSPLAWVAYIIPGQKQYWDKWWKEFLQWSFFPAVFGFFIYLGVSIGIEFQSTALGNAKLVDGLGETSALPFTTMGLLLQYIMVITILFFGLSQAQKWGISGADSAIKIGSGVKNWTLGKVKGGIRGIKGTAKGAAKLTAGAATQAVPERTRMAARERLEKIPLVGRAIGGPGARHAAKQKALKEQQGRMKNLRPQDLEAIAAQKVATPAGEARRAAAIAELAKKGKLDDGNKKHFQSFLNAGGDASDILKSNPTWAFDENIQNTLAKNPATASDWEDVTKLDVGSEERENLANKVYTKKYLPRKPEDFSKIRAKELDTEETRPDGIPELQWDREIERRKAVMRTFKNEFMEGGALYRSHLGSAANKNPELHSVLTRALNKTEVFDTLRKDIRNYLESPGGATLSGDSDKDKSDKEESSEKESSEKEA